MAARDLKDVFIECQDSQNHHQLIKAFHKIYDQMPFEEFWTQFLKLIKHPFVVYAREPAVEKTVEFIAKAVTDLTLVHSKQLKLSKQKKKDVIDEDEEDEDMHPLLMRLFSFLLDVHSAKERAVRFRVCQLVTQLLHNLGEGAQIDDALYYRLYQCMVERLRDKCPLVRVHAVLALTRLQDPADENCPITKAYIILMTRDPNAEVRRIVLTCIAPSTFSLSAILERIHDVKDTVRRTAFTVIAEKIPLKALNFEQRIQLLQDGLSDRSEAVQIACSSKLLQAWLSACEGNVLELLSRLDVESSVKICEKALCILFKNSGILNLVQKFDMINERALIDEANLTCESAFYWRNLVQFIHGEGHDYVEQFDQVCPNCVEFCAYIKSFTKLMADCSDMERRIELEFILQQLLHIITLMDFSDEASRKATEKLLHGMLVLDSIGPALVPHILSCMKKVHTDTEDLINCIAETISDIREPITTVETQESLNADAQRNVDKKIASIRVKLHQLREELSDCIEKQDFENAARLKADIYQLDGERSSLMEASKPKLEEVRIQKNDSVTILKCLTIICELLMNINVKTLSPSLQALMESQILPGMVNEESEVRNAAVKAIGLCCLIKKDIIMHHLALLLQAAQMDTQLVKATALKSVFDLVHVFGLDAFSDEDTSVSKETSINGEVKDHEELDNTEEQQNVTMNSAGEDADTTKENLNENDRKGWTETAGKVIAILSSFLDNESSELRNIAAEGMSKLLLSGRVVSSKLLSHLLLLWYNPLVEDDEALLQCLGVFFPLYAFSCSSNQQQIEEAFIPTLRTLLHAPSTSPLREINEVNVATFLMELTDAQHLIDNQKSKTPVLENPCHDNIAVKLCNEIISHPDSFSTKLWLRVLSQLSVSPENASLLKDLCAMCEDMAMVVTEKQCVKLLQKFRDTLYAQWDAIKKVSQMTDKAVINDKHSCAVTDGGDGGFSQASVEQIISHSENEADENVAESKTLPASSSVVKRNATAGRKAVKTPAVSKPVPGKGTKYLPESASRMHDTSALNYGVFATPLKSSRITANIEDTRVDLENLMSESLSKTPAMLGKTPKTPRRPLHNSQDPTFKG
ncbi:unnamed protein product [Candidula unifasciata]|uniref:Condensin complex subunit 3 n=1 Tax=Candidula unifasciata TaxID=100452 RepID=A0A8S3ZLT4_9EUPU|nr:unnamed protein product [Candidula unifasciata]